MMVTATGKTGQSLTPFPERSSRPEALRGYKESFVFGNLDNLSSLELKQEVENTSSRSYEGLVRQSRDNSMLNYSLDFGAGTVVTCCAKHRLLLLALSPAAPASLDLYLRLHCSSLSHSFFLTQHVRFYSQLEPERSVHCTGDNLGRTLLRV